MRATWLSYPLIAFGDAEVSTDGYAAGFVAEWMNARLSTGATTEQGGVLTLGPAHRALVEEQLACFR